MASASPGPPSAEAEGLLEKSSFVCGGEGEPPSLRRSREVWTKAEAGMRSVVTAVTSSQNRIPEISVSFSPASQDRLTASLRYPSVSACNALAARVDSSSLRDSLFSAAEVSLSEARRKVQVAASLSKTSRREKALRVAASYVAAAFAQLPGAEVRLALKRQSASSDAAEQTCGAESSTPARTSVLSPPLLPEEASFPLLVLVGGPSGSGKSSFLPMLLHMLSHSIPPLKGVASTPSSYAVFSTDFLRQVLRAFCSSAGPSEDKALILRSTYRLQGVALAQLEGLSENADAKGEEGFSETDKTNSAAVEPPKKRRVSLRERRKALLQEGPAFLERLTQELDCVGGDTAWKSCNSCGEAVPCSAVLGMLEQALLVQSLALEPLVEQLMQPCGTCATDKTDSQGERKRGRTEENPSMQRPRLVLVEGIHLTPAFCMRMQQKFGRRCLCFSAFCRSREEHVRRLRRRSSEEKDAALRTLGGAGETERIKELGLGSPQRRVEGEGLLSPQSQTSGKSSGSPALKEGATAEEHERNIKCIRCAQLFFCLAAQSSLDSQASGRQEEGRSFVKANAFLSEAADETRGAGEEASRVSAEVADCALRVSEEASFQTPRIYPLETQDAALALSVAQQIAERQWKEVSLPTLSARDKRREDSSGKQSSLQEGSKPPRQKNACETK